MNDVIQMANNNELLSWCNCTGGYKGYGLAMMVEVFCGILSGSAFGPFIRNWKGDERVANLVSTKLRTLF